MPRLPGALQPRAVAVVAGAVLLCAAPLPADASSPARRAAEYLVAHQAPDGTFFGDDAPQRTAETLVALVAGGTTGGPVSRALAAATAGGPGVADRAGEAGLLVLGIVAAGGDPRDYVARIHSFYDETLGAYDTQQFQNALALLGLVAAGEKLRDEAITFLRLNRCPDGGIPIQVPCGGAGGHVDVTALALQALVRHGLPPSDFLRADARSFLVAARNGEGGFGDKKGAATNANSTGLVLATVAALGESTADAPWREALPLLLGLQQPDGRFRQSRAAEGDAYLATRQAILGVAGRPHPVQPSPAPPRDEQRSAAPTTTPKPVTAARSATTPPPPSVASPISPSTTLPATPDITLGRNSLPERRISPQSAVEERRGRRRRPSAWAAFAGFLSILVAAASMTAAIASPLGRRVRSRGMP